jgi:arylsulfatase
MISQVSGKPNLVVFLPDQQRADTIACYGGTKVHSPNLTRLASESVIFERAYVTHPVCTPSRASLLTGTWPHQNGCTRNSVALPTRLKCLPELVDGYASAYFGKWHLGNDAQPQHGFTHWVSTEEISDYSRFLTSKGYRPDRPDGTFSTLAVSKLPIELSKPRFLEEHACKFIEQHRQEPFILFVAFVEPHSPYNGPMNGEHPLSEIELDATALAPPREDLPLRYRLMREWQESEAILDRARLPEQYYFGVTPDEYKAIKQRYLGLVTLIDQSIGAILECLAQHDLVERTIVVHTSDHGDMLGGQHLFGKEVMFEEASRVPYLVRMPGQQTSRRIEQPISHIDFVPTLIELLGGVVTEQCAGSSRARLLHGESMPQESIFIEWAPNRTKVKKGTSLASRRAVKRAITESTRTVITPEGWKLSLRDRDICELYDLGNDPDESRNLYFDDRYENVIQRCANEIFEWQKKTGDKLRLKVR